MRTPNPEITRVLLQRCAELEQRADERRALGRRGPLRDRLARAAGSRARRGACRERRGRASAARRLARAGASARAARAPMRRPPDPRDRLGGYSTIWLARGLRPGGRIVTLERSPARAAVA